MAYRAYTVLFFKEKNDDVKLYVLFNSVLGEFVVFGSRVMKKNAHDAERPYFYMRYDISQINELSNFIRFVLCVNSDSECDLSVDVNNNTFVVDLYTISLYPYDIADLSFEYIDGKCTHLSEIVGYDYLPLSKTRVDGLLRMICSE